MQASYFCASNISIDKADKVIKGTTELDWLIIHPDTKQGDQSAVPKRTLIRLDVQTERI